jgi:7-cyano-7-deazaguanine synthase in queuosine biosynthesis
LQSKDFVLVLCNGSKISKELKNKEFRNTIKLEYRRNKSWDKNINLKLPDFVQGVYHLPDRILDLLEISAYVYCADRLVKRGTKRDLEYQGWSRNFCFVIKVRDIDFWQESKINNELNEILKFITGDNQYNFIFQSGHSTPPTGLFDSEKFEIKPEEETIVTLFSGGLDSLTGVLKLLHETEAQIYLISHLSYQPSISRTQDKLFKALTGQYPNRLHHYKYYCSLSLKGKRTVEESQRSRSFLFTSIAYALTHGLSQKSFYIFENGVTSINFTRRTDMINARNSRTTHPRTIALFKEFYSKLEEESIDIKNPFLWKTKTDVFELLKDFNEERLIPSSVSCSKTFNSGEGTHCGGCFQCIDRRFAAFASNLEDRDGEHLYNLNFINQSIKDKEVKITLIDYIAQAVDFANSNIDKFYVFGDGVFGDGA